MIARSGHAWVVGAVALAAVACAEFAAGLDPERWAWQRAAMAAEPWRWVSGALVHWNGFHALANGAGALVLAFVGARAGMGGDAARAWALALPLAQAGLWLKPDLQEVAGLSGWLHAGVAVLALDLVAQGVGRDRLWGAAIGLGLLVKLGLEQPWGPALRTEALWGDMPVVPWAHATGAAAGALAWAGLSAFRRRPGSAGSAGPSAAP